MNKFPKRTYTGPLDMAADLLWPFRHRDSLRRAMRGGLVSPQFRERLMLTVTAVNHCRYCFFYHAREALASGLSEAEIQKLQDGIIAEAPANELQALLYAQHWAEQNGRPDHEIRQQFIAAYGRERAGAIETVLRMIRTGNLLGNSTDWLLYKFSFGRFGLQKIENKVDKSP